MEHTDTRKAIIDMLESHIGKDTLYLDGRPAVLEEGDFPAVAVFLADAGYADEKLDADIRQATLHIEIFLSAQVPGSELDDRMELCIYPVLDNVPGLPLLINNMAQQGYDYRHGDDLELWSPVDLEHSITYEM